MSDLLQSRRRALLLVNRRARRGHQSVSEAVQQLQALGFDAIEESTEQPRRLPDLIRRYRHQVDLVIVGGGDGTLNAAVEGCQQQPRERSACQIMLYFA